MLSIAKVAVVPDPLVSIPVPPVSVNDSESKSTSKLPESVATSKSSASAGSIVFKEDTDNGTNSATLKGPAATADVTLTLLASDGTVSTESFATAIAVALG